MIAPEVAIVDLEPDGFATLCALMAGRERARRPVLQILHEDGRVLRVVHSTRGALEEHHEPFTEPERRAEELLEQTGVGRVVLLDRRGLGALAREIDGFATPGRTQAELLWAANERFWANPCVATAPAAPRIPWAGMGDRLTAWGPQAWGVLAAWRGEELAFTLIARIEHGRVTLLSSGMRFGWPRPPREEAMRIVECAEGLGHVPLALLCDVDALERMLSHEDALVGLQELAAECIYERGLEAIA